MLNYTPKDVKRFWSKVDQKTSNECWNWKAGTFSNGYGQFYVQGKNRGSHVVSYELSNNAAPESLKVLHKCDNRLCCNPAHLFLGTDMDNVQDKMQKGRMQSMAGEMNPGHKLTRFQVETIRSRYAAGGVLQRQLATEYGVKRTTISSIINKHRWGDNPQNVQPQKQVEMCDLCNIPLDQCEIPACPFYSAPEPKDTTCGLCGSDISDCGGAVQIDVDVFECRNTRRRGY